nr:hypothetical protein [Tanacetum cinerariifolium]
MNYKPVVAGNQSNGSAGKARVETVPDKDYILLPLWTQDPLLPSSSKESLGDGFKPSREEEKKDSKDPRNDDYEVLSTKEPRVNQEKDVNVNNTNTIYTVSPSANVASIKDNVVDKDIVYGLEPKKVIQALTDPSWIEAMQDELLQFKLQQGYTQEEGIDYDEVFAPIARIEAIRLFLAYASFKDFIVYQMDVKSVFMYGKIKEEVYVCQPPGFDDLDFPDRVYKVEKALYGLHQAYRAWKEMCTEFEKMMHKKFQMSSMGKLTLFLGLQVTQKDDGIFIIQDKYVDEILKKFGFLTVKTTSTPMETSKPLLKDENAEDVDDHLYRSMIGSLIIFRYLKGQPKLSLWYPKDSSFNLEAYTDSDYAGASLDRKSTAGGCQFLENRLISWQCKKQTVVANSTTKA